MNKLGEPIVVVLLPRPSAAVALVRDMVVPGLCKPRVIALADSHEEAEKFKSFWHASNVVSLLIFIQKNGWSARQSSELVADIAEDCRDRPLAVVLSDGEGAPGFNEARRKLWNETFASALAESFDDLQVLEYSPSWRHSPPRIR